MARSAPAPSHRRRSGERGEAAGSRLALPPETRRACRLDRWEPRRSEPGGESLAAAFWAARRLALGYRTVGHMLTLAGPPGTGKTHLALAIAWEWVERFEEAPWEVLSDRELERLFEESRDARQQGWRGESPWCRRPVYPRDHGVRFARVGELLDWLRQGYEDGTYFALLRECQGCRLLVLDDLGHQRETAWGLEVVDRIIDARYLGGRPTVVTTNLAGDQLPPRIASRLRDRRAGFVANLEAEDYRPLRRSARREGEGWR